MPDKFEMHASPKAQDAGEAEAAVPGKKLTPAARRALGEAAERRRQAAQNPAPPPKEVNGPRGPEPTRYGDWERKGRVSDF